MHKTSESLSSSYGRAWPENEGPLLPLLAHYYTERYSWSTLAIFLSAMATKTVYQLLLTPTRYHQRQLPTTKR